MDPNSEENEDLKKEEGNAGESADANASTSVDDGNAENGAGNAEPESSLDAMVQALEGDDDNADDDKSKEAKADDEQKEKTDGQEKEKTDDKPSDEELTAPLPEDAKAETRERFDKLAASYKDVKQEYETVTQENMQLKQDVTDFQGLIEYSGATPEEFNALVDYSHMVKNGDLKGALKLLDEQRSNIAMMLGEPVAGVDVLAGHDDLRERVDKYGLDEEVAAELAAARNQKAANEKAMAERNAQLQSEQQTTAQQTAVLEKAQADIIGMASEWSKNDIDYPAKHDKLMAKAQEIAKTYAPELWGQAMQLYYESLSNVSQAQDTTRNSQKNNHRPLRPGGGAGGDHAPKSSLEAIEQALGAA